MKIVLIFTISFLSMSLPASAIDNTCEKAAAYQVSGEPGMHECLSHRTISADCNAVIMASMTKRINECQEARRTLHGE